MAEKNEMHTLCMRRPSGSIHKDLLEPTNTLYDLFFRK